MAVHINVTQSARIQSFQPLNPEVEKGLRLQSLLVTRIAHNGFMGTITGSDRRSSEFVGRLIGGMHEPEDNSLDGFLCPITFDLMEDPVTAPSGNSYERSAIEKAIDLHGREPLTQAPLRKDQLNPNRALKTAIAEWKLKNDLSEKRVQEALKEAQGAKAAEKAAAVALVELNKKAAEKSAAIDRFHEEIFGHCDTSSDKKTEKKTERSEMQEMRELMEAMRLENMRMKQRMLQSTNQQQGRHRLQEQL